MIPINSNNNRLIELVPCKTFDEIFFEKLTNLKGQALHAQTLEFIHPTSKKWMIFNSNLPTDFKKMLDLLTNLSG